MPNLVSDYHAPTWLRGGDLQTLYPHFFRKLPPPAYERVRLETTDGDFLDLDWKRKGHRRLVILAHGLEGHSKRWYMVGMANAANLHGWDAVAWNFRGCSGELNRKPYFYHGGLCSDLSEVITYCLKQGGYETIVLLGFSMGGNIVLRYLGMEGAAVPAEVRAAVAFSVPCHFASGAAKLAHWTKKPYMLNFLRTLNDKLVQKAAVFPDLISLEGLAKIRTFKQFDDRYVAPFWGFRDAEDYWESVSARYVLAQIQRPTLLVNALNDPFLAPPSFPFEIAASHPYFYFEAPKTGGHIGFPSLPIKELSWAEARTFAFLNVHCEEFK